MILRMKANDFLRLRGACGAAIEVLSGKVWITEDGRSGDALLGPGGTYRVRGSGFVLVGAETRADEAAEIALKAA